MDRTSEKHNLAIRYFNGKITRDDERELFEFINENPQNLSLFRQWEKQWASAMCASTEVEREWKKLQARLLAKEAIAPMIPKRRFTFRRIGAWVASAVILVCLSITASWYYFHQANSCFYFVSEAPLGGKSKVLLADGSLVWLNSGSTLKYSTDFNEKERIVTLSGEGYFEVSKKNGMPFTVRTQGYDVVVKGTKFNVSAYEGDPFISTTLIEGRVTVNYKDESIDMNPGEEMKLIKNTGELQHTSVNAFQSNAWMDNQLVNDNITFQDLMIKLSRHFNVKIEIEDERLKFQTFSISLRNDETLEQIFKALQKIIPFSVTWDNHVYHIKSINH